MRNIRTKSGPFVERPHFKLREIEEICAAELSAAGLYPTSPEPIRIERFIEKRFGVSPQYDTLPEGVLGYTKFGRKGVETIVIAAALDEEASKVAERRLRSTLAHEGGHGLLHAYLFSLGEKPTSLFGEADQTPHILCRDVPDAPLVARSYDGRWWEFQANKAIGGLLMPRRLVEIATQEFCVEAGMLGQRVLPPQKREQAVRALSETFDVNPAVARLRLGDLFPTKSDDQLLL
jgi:hypothetical protein